MLSLEVCKKILNEGQKTFNDEQVKMIREYLYLVATLEIENNKLKIEEQ